MWQDIFKIIGALLFHDSLFIHLFDSGFINIKKNSYEKNFSTRKIKLVLYCKDCIASDLYINSDTGSTTEPVENTDSTTEISGEGKKILILQMIKHS